jgi:dTDP-4-dehydrorhamnose reductase
LGRELRRALSATGDIIAPSRSYLDLRNTDRLREKLRVWLPNVIVNAAAYTRVDEAEQERDLAFLVNATAPRVLAEEAARSGALLIHYSTDYVFDGECRRPYLEEDTPNPLNVYGESKLAGEEAITKVGGGYFTLRIGWLYGTRGKNFLSTVRKLARSQKQVRIVRDQIGVPTWTRPVAEGTAALISKTWGSAETHADRSFSGVYHFSGRGQASWCDFAKEILTLDGPRPDGRAPEVVPIETSEYPTPARRPKYSVMDSSRMAETFGLSLPDWRDQLGRALENPEVNAETDHWSG